MVTLKQLKVARAMARQYGHLWGSTCPDCVLERAVDEGDINIIHNYVLRKFWIDRGIDPDSKEQQRRAPYHGATGPGICGPQIAHVRNGEHAIHHTTATGRVLWFIYNTRGDVRLDILISRKLDGHTITIMSVILTGGDEDSDVKIDQPKYVCCRHLFALTEAVYNARIAMKEIE